VTVVDELLVQLAVGLEEPIEVCRGYALDSVREWLSKQGYTWTTIS